LGCFLLYNKGSLDQNFETQVHSETKRFTYHELKDITNNFSRTIGKGGFGVVYHGYLKNHIEVAVKLCSPESGQGSNQFLAEVLTIQYKALFY
jgi:predicted Ser/Thr protein kinase